MFWGEAVVCGKSRQDALVSIYVWYFTSHLSLPSLDIIFLHKYICLVFYFTPIPPSCMNLLKPVLRPIEVKSNNRNQICFPRQNSAWHITIA